MTLRLVPLTLAQANDLIERLHRHHKRVVGHRFSIGAQNGNGLIGAVVVGRPVARVTDQNNVAEITRLVTDGTPHACSMLYAAAARAAKAMGYQKIQTFILESEPGTSVRAAGFKFEAMSGGGDWNRPSRGGRRVDQPMDRKQKWSKVLNAATTTKGERPPYDMESGRPACDARESGGHCACGGYHEPGGINGHYVDGKRVDTTGELE